MSREHHELIIQKNMDASVLGRQKLPGQGLARIWFLELQMHLKLNPISC